MEKTLLVTVDLGNREGWTAEERAKELKELALSTNAAVLKEEIVRRKEISPAYFIGEGKAKEFYDICKDMDIDVVIFNNDLSGSQQRNLEEIIETKTVDRTQLILDIFARRAKSNEGKIQVELAQLLYLLPRLSGEGIFLSRLGGGIGTRGPGEQKLEAGRRRIRERITKLKRDLDRLNLQRATRRKQRMKFSLLTVAIIGYTNSGKSTLLNSLTDSDVFVQDKLFSTLDPTVRSFVLPNNHKILFADTVGFLNNLPHHLIESFKATLEEVVNADILLHLIDISHPKAREMERSVYGVLEELRIQDKPVITALNKIDKVDENDMKKFLREFDNAISISALKKENFQSLFDKIILYLNKLVKILRISIPQSDARLINLLHEKGHIITKEYRGNDVYLEVEIPVDLYEKVKNREGK